MNDWRSIAISLMMILNPKTIDYEVQLEAQADPNRKENIKTITYPVMASM